MSKLLSVLMSSSGGEPNPPANIVFENVDSNHYITYKAKDGQHYWTKVYAGLCYGGFMVFMDGDSSYWIIALTVSEVRQNCFMRRDGWSVYLTA